MVIYDLICSLNHKFEAWFRDQASFEKQLQQGLVQCSVCGNSAVRRTPSGCHVSKTPQTLSPSTKRASEATVSTRQHPTAQKTQNIDPVVLLKTMHKYIKDNFQDVGPQFADRVIQMHEGAVPFASVYGTTDQEQRDRLDDAGISYVPLPLLPESP